MPTFELTTLDIPLQESGGKPTVWIPLENPVGHLCAVESLNARLYPKQVAIDLALDRIERGGAGPAESVSESWPLHAGFDVVAGDRACVEGWKFHRADAADEAVFSIDITVVQVVDAQRDLGARWHSTKWLGDLDVGRRGDDETVSAGLASLSQSAVTDAASQRPEYLVVERYVTVTGVVEPVQDAPVEAIQADRLAVGK